MNIKKYRESQPEQERVQSLLNLVQEKGQLALDIGARDGYISIALTEYFERVIALDLVKPSITHPKVITEKGNVISLYYPDNYFDLVLCAEVLEHIPPHLLSIACSEISRVAKETVIIGVPYRQDIRVGRTTCPSCGAHNPPWGHINVFDEEKLSKLFSEIKLDKILYQGTNYERTNFISRILLDLAGNPYGTYNQEEEYIYCNSKITGPLEMDLLQKIETKIAHVLNIIQLFFIEPQPNWIHISFKKF